ncbi:MAG: Panacea domain-containing protein [Candidatus Kaiserbacteria bacterium]|nr:Panacea domain-containing protein [Candidatus Kaiserbacteria bacterium]
MFTVKKYVSGFNGQILDPDRINALAVKFVDAFEKRGDSLYITKLLKLFFYFDFVSYKNQEKPFTGDIYFKLPYGPIPSFIKEQLDLLKKENDENEELKDFELKSIFAKYLETKKDEGTKGHTLKIREGADIPRENFEDYFSDGDNELLSAIVKAFDGKNVREVVAMTHQEVPYVKVKWDTGIIDYLLAFDKDFPKALPNYRSV